jgi:two-component SAPR family response regulator
MSHQVITRVSMDSFRKRSAGKKIVLLYPWSSYRNVFLSHFLNQAEEGLLYYRVADQVSSLADWMEDLAAELNGVLGGFGENLAKSKKSAKPATLGEALAKDLSAYSSKGVILYIDELDRVPFDDEFTKFISALLAGLRDNHQIAISSRMLRRQPWYGLIQEGKAVILGTEHRKDDAAFAASDEEKPHLEVYAFGRGHALVNGQEILNWDGALPRNLFFYFIDNTLITRDDIFATFWPGLSVKEATNVFHVTKRKITERLSLRMSNGREIELTQYGAGFYTPSDNIIRHYDVADFQATSEQALMLSDPAEQEKLFSLAIDLYRAPFLEGVDLPWVQARRFHLEQLHTQVLAGMAAICQGRGETERALGYYSRAIRSDALREDIHEAMMRIYLDAGMPDEARKQYRYLADILDKAYKIKPSAPIRELYESIKG